MIPSDFFFKNVAASWLFLFLPILAVLFWLLFRYRHNILEQFGKEILISRAPSLFWTKCGAFLLAWAAATFALMQPQGNAHYVEEKQKKGEGRRITQEVILLIDCSASMTAQDSHHGMSRLEDAKDIADQIVSRLEGQSVSLYAFTSELTSLSPATMDYLFVRLRLRQMQVNEGDVAGTNLVAALQNMHRQILSLPAQRAKSLILISDGGDTALDQLSESEKEKAISSLLDLYDNTLHLRIHAIGMGSHKGAVVPDVTDVTDHGQPVYASLQGELMRRLARRTGGIYMEANETTSPNIVERLVALLQDQAASAQAEEATPSGQNRSTFYDRYFQIPLGIAILLLLFVLVWPDTWRRA